MLSADDLTYAIENTEVLITPKRRLATFSTSLFNYCLITEEMDSVNVTRIREGQIHAERPQLLAPQYMAKLFLEGFGPEGQRFADQASTHPIHGKLLKYGFFLRKSEVRNYDVHESFNSVTGRLQEELARKNDPLLTLLKGVDVGWEICLLKAMLELISNSVGGNVSDFREQGLL